MTTKGLPDLSNVPPISGAAQPLRVRVTQVIRQTADAHTLVLEPAEGYEDSFSYQPGQFLKIRIPTGNSGGLARCYSLCSSPLKGEPLRITVKRTAGGYGSNWVCDNVVEGDDLEVLRPAGSFVPVSLAGDFLLFAGGSGITPVMSILKSALAGGTGHVVLVYANQDERSVIFRDELMDLALKYPNRLTVIHWLESVQGLPSQSMLEELAAPYREREVYLCGPEPFMDCVQAALRSLQLPAAQIHIERFSSLETDPFSAAPARIEEVSDDSPIVEAELDGVTHKLPWPAGNRLLDVLLDAGADAPFSCREGACSACACMVLEGEVQMERNEVLDANDLKDGIILACQAFPVSDLVRITYES